jgi:hypothetical protein
LTFINEHYYWYSPKIWVRKCYSPKIVHLVPYSRVLFLLLAVLQSMSNAEATYSCRGLNGSDVIHITHPLFVTQITALPCLDTRWWIFLWIFVVFPFHFGCAFFDIKNGWYGIFRLRKGRSLLVLSVRPLHYSCNLIGMFSESK